MKKLIPVLLLVLLGCNKKQSEPETKTTTPPPIISVPDKTVTISAQTSCGGQLRVIWEYDYQCPFIDSVYNYTPLTNFTKTVTGDSLRLYFYSSACSVCSPCPSNITIYVNGIVNRSWAGNNGASFYLIKL